MDKMYNSNLIDNAKSLRKNMTKEEKHLWYDFLKKHELQFYRQKVIGKYIVDFYCPSVKLVIELDGSQHFEEKGIEYDTERTKYLEQFGVVVVRISNDEINYNFDNTCEYLEALINSRI